MDRLDMDFVRGAFPALADGFTFMDNAGGSQTLATVAERISDYLLGSNVQLGASYAVSRRSGERVDEAVARMADFVNAASPEEIVLGSSTSMLMKILAWSFAETLAPGDEIIVCRGGHAANMQPWTDLRERGLVVRDWAMDPETLHADLAELEALLGPHTKLVAVHHVSNVLGNIEPIRAIADLAHQHGALVCVDGVAFAPHRLIDVAALDVDFYAFSFYKVYGPHYALLYGRKRLLDALPAINFDFIASGPYRFQPGNLNFELAWGMTAVPDYLEALASHHGSELSGRAAWARAFELIAVHEVALAERLLAFLRGKARVRIIGAPSSTAAARVPTISFVVDGMASDEVVAAVDPHGIGIRFGDFYAVDLIDDLGLREVQGVVRVSLVHYNTLDEVDRLIEILDGLF